MVVSQRLYSKLALAKAWCWSHAVTITGASGCGTSNAILHLQKLLTQAEIWRWRFLSGGDIMRRKTVECGMNKIEDFVAFNRNNPQAGHDRDCDGELAAFGKGNYVVMESRLSHILAPHAFHVQFICPLEIRAERCRDRYPGKSLDYVRGVLQQRDADDHARFAAMYPGYDWPCSDFDLVVDTSKIEKQEVAPLILAKHAEWLEEKATLGMIVRGATLPAGLS